MGRCFAVLAAGLALSMAPAASAAVIVNGSFETGVDPGSFATLSAGNSSSIPGWIVGGSSIDYVGSYWQAANGSRSIDLEGTGGTSALGSISQAIDTVIGQLYRVTFSVARNPDGGVDPRTGFVDVGGAPTLISFNGPATTKSNMGWEERTFDFTAVSALTNLRFSADPATSLGQYGLTLDNVSIASVATAVPEPATWAMMLVGFGAIGATMRRKRRQTVNYSFA